MLPEGLVEVKIKSTGDIGRIAWAEGKNFRLPKAALESFGLDISGQDGLVIPKDIRLNATSGVEALRLMAAFTDTRPASSRLPFSYQAVPPWARSIAASFIGRIKRRGVKKWGAFPKWPIDLSADFLADLSAETPSPFAKGPTPLIISHDIDSLEGLKNLVTDFLPLEESCGARSVNYVVPCAWPVDHGLLDEVCARGHEIGIHGFDHGNLTPFSPPEERQRRLEGALPLIKRYRVTGYRAPSLLRTRVLLSDLTRYYAYDSSIPTSGGLFPAPNNGCASARPFTVVGIREIPLSLPRDGSLRFLGHTPEEILNIWTDCMREIANSGGVAVLLTHCEERFSGNKQMLNAYKRFLEFAASSDSFVFSSTADVLKKTFGYPGNNDGHCAV